MFRNKRIVGYFGLLFILLILGVQAVAAQQEQVIASTDGAVSVHVPAGWVASSQPPGPVYSTVLIFAQDQAVLETAIRSAGSSSPMATAPGAYGVVTIFTPQSWTMLSGDPQQALLMFLDGVTKNNLTPDTTLTVNNVFQAAIGGANAIVYDVSTSPKINSRGYLGGLVSNNTVAIFQLVIAPASNFESGAQLLQAIGATIRIPAEAGAIPAANAGATPTPVQLQNLPTLGAPNNLPTQALLNPQLTVAPPAQPTSVAGVPSPVPNAAMTLQRSSGDKLSLQLPANWVFIDHAADQAIVGFGDSEAAAQSRIGAIRPDLVNPPVATTGSGGVVVLYKMSDFGVNPAAPDLKPLLDRVLSGLKNSGYQVVIEPGAMAVGPVQGLGVVVSGAETGFLVLAPFGDQIAYITATVAGSAGNLAGEQALQAQLAAIVDSVRVPAEQPASPTPGTGLGGLQALPTQAPATGGLGGLQAPAATPEAGS